MSCPKSLEIIKISKDHLYSDLGKIVMSYLNFIPLTPEELFPLAYKFLTDGDKSFKDLEIRICEGNVIFSVNTFNITDFCTFVILYEEYQELLKTD